MKLSNVNHPAHYNQPGHRECIVEMREQLGDQAVYDFCRCNAFKYRYRAGCKPGAAAGEDLAKAMWYDAYADSMKAADPVIDNAIRLMADELKI